MGAAPSQAQIDAAWMYERLFVPAEFQEWAQRMIAAAAIRPGERVLDIACGTGVLARNIATEVGADGAVVGLDPDLGMIAVAAQLAPTVQFREGVAERLPYAEESFDAVVSQFGLMFFQDRIRALQEMERVLKPGGRIAVAVWGALEDTPVYDVLVRILETVAGAEAAAPLRAPFALGDPSALASVFERAGLADVRIETEVGRSRFPSIRTLVEADLRGWLPLNGVTLRQAQIEAIIARAELELAQHCTSGGEIHFDSPAHIATVAR